MLEGTRWTLPAANLLASSAGRNWGGVAAERRRHSPGELPEMAADVTVVGIALSGNPSAVIHRRGNGVRQATQARTGAIWLCPRGIAEDEIRISEAIPEMLHIYLPSFPFEALSREDGWPEIRAETVGYDAGFTDPLVRSLAAAIAAELARETSSGRLLVETAALTLAARLVQRHSTIALRPRAAQRNRPALDGRRLRRVLAYLDANLGADVTLADMACVACLSPFHFARAFKAATGTSPCRYMTDKRLERAKGLLAHTSMTLSDVALAANFATGSSFTKAFRCAVGVSPSRYRRSQARHVQ